MADFKKKMFGATNYSLTAAKKPIHNDRADSDKAQESSGYDSAKVSLKDIIKQQLKKDEDTCGQIFQIEMLLKTK